MADSTLASLPELTAPADEDLLYAVDDPSGTPVERKLTIGVLRKHIGAPQLLYVRDERADGVGGDSAVATTWNIRTINTVEVNQITGASLASNQITLPAGTYRIWADAYVKSVADHKLRLRNVTDGETAVVGASDYSHLTSDDLGMRAQMMGRFTIDAEKDFEIQHYTTNTASNAFGTASSSGEVELYLNVQILREPD